MYIVCGIYLKYKRDTTLRSFSELRESKSVIFYVYHARLSLFREYPDPKVKRVIMATSVLQVLWDLPVYPVHRYVNCP